ncbi:RelA/SpoT domain-containing protein [Alteromonas sp. KUL150]|uniref:RelA/SpoT domain-containing protein n=1 Tax=Alteromonas sp. KUL150 TaxID=2480805 RepID=UPI001F3BE7F1|nr:RelA/SpoT domain-containing protein [Alteromonas sp. KUL150]
MTGESFQEQLNKLGSGFKVETKQSKANARIVRAVIELDKLRERAISSNSGQIRRTFSKSSDAESVINPVIVSEQESKSHGLVDVLKTAAKKGIKTLLPKGKSNNGNLKTHSQFEEEYRDIYPILKTHSEELYDLVNRKLKRYEDELAFPAQIRIKKFDSVIEKIKHLNASENISKTSRKNHNNELRIDKVADIQDLIGIRIVTIFEKDISKIEALIKNSFKTKRSYTPDYMGKVFGYPSRHIVVNRLVRKGPSVKRETKILVEIQVMTLAQFTYAKVSRALTYKNNVVTNDMTNRSLLRASVLLESVDIELGSNFIDDKK